MLLTRPKDTKTSVALGWHRRCRCLLDIPAIEQFQHQVIPIAGKAQQISDLPQRPGICYNFASDA